MSLAGGSLRTGVALLSLLGAAAVAAAVLLLDFVAGSDDRRRRAVVLVGLNPLVLIPVVAGAHVDALLVLAVVAAVAAVRRRPLLAGAVAGAGFSVKLTGALVVVGLAWWLRGDGRRLAAFALGVAVVAVPGSLLVGGWAALAQARHAARFVSLATPWRVLVAHGANRGLVSAAAAIVAAIVVWALHRRLPGSARPAWAPAVLLVAWVLSATYVLPWYDAAAWAALATLGWSRLDELLLVHTTALTLAYLPGLEVALPRGLAAATKTMRVSVAPAVLLAVLATVLVKSGGRQVAPAAGAEI
jgi:hypothetical protein